MVYTEMGPEGIEVLARIAEEESGVNADALDILGQITLQASGQGSENAFVSTFVQASDEAESLEILSVSALIRIATQGEGNDEAVNVLARILEADTGSLQEETVEAIEFAIDSYFRRKSYAKRVHNFFRVKNHVKRHDSIYKEKPVGYTRWDQR